MNRRTACQGFISLIVILKKKKRKKKKHDCNTEVNKQCRAYRDLKLAASYSNFPNVKNSALKNRNDTQALTV